MYIARIQFALLCWRDTNDFRFSHQWKLAHEPAVSWDFSLLKERFNNRSKSGSRKNKSKRENFLAHLIFIPSRVDWARLRLRYAAMSMKFSHFIALISFMQAWSSAHLSEISPHNFILTLCWSALALRMRSGVLRCVFFHSFSVFSRRAMRATLNEFEDRF